MSFTRISDNLMDSSLWSDDSHEGLATLKLFLAILFEARARQGRIRRLTPAKAARIAAIPLDLAAVAIERLTGPDEGDSSGVADGRRLLPDPEGAPNDYIITNWEAYGREFERDSKTIRQRRWRDKKREECSAAVDESVYTPSTGRRDVDGGETQEEKETKKTKETKEKKTPSESKKTKAESLVEGFELQPKHREWAARNTPSVPVDTEFDAWKDRCRSNGYMAGKNLIVNAQASFYSACRNAENWGTYRKPGSQRGASLNQQASRIPVVTELESILDGGGAR